MKRALLICCLLLLPGCRGMADVLTVTLQGRSGLKMPPIISPELVEADRELSTFGEASFEKGLRTGFPPDSPTIAVMKGWCETKNRLLGQSKKEIPVADKPMDPVPQAEVVLTVYKKEVGAHTADTADYLTEAAEEAAKPGTKTVSITSGMVGWLMRIGGAGFGLTVGLAVYQWIKKRAAKVALRIAQGQAGAATLAVKGLVGAINKTKLTQPTLYDDGTNKCLKAHLKAAPHDAGSSALINEIRRA